MVVFSDASNLRFRFARTSPTIRAMHLRLLVLILMLSGWASAAMAEDAPAPAIAANAACLAAAPEELKPHWQRICAGESRNAVLDRLHGGLAALATGHLDLAE